MFLRVVVLIVFISTMSAKKPELFLLKTYQTGHSISGMLMSEKLDGVRAYWDGQELISRSGRVFNTPSWFTKDFPSFELDGELWTKRSDFEAIVSIVNRKKPHKGWKDIKYHIFEVPHAEGGLLDRLSHIKNYLHKHPLPNIHVIKQSLCKNEKALKLFVAEVKAMSGEGVVLRDKKALYHVKRTLKDLKVKPYFDTECKVVAYKKGRGKFKGKMGALKCEMVDKMIVYIGSGFTLAQREKPVSIGSIITFKYFGKTKYGKPKFPVFLRVRQE